MTMASIVENPVGRTVRDTIFGIVGHLPPVRRQMAARMAHVAL